MVVSVMVFVVSAWWWGSWCLCGGGVRDGGGVRGGGGGSGRMGLEVARREPRMMGSCMWGGQVDGRWNSQW